MRFKIVLLEDIADGTVNGASLTKTRSPELPFIAGPSMRVKCGKCNQENDIAIPEGTTQGATVQFPCPQCSTMNQARAPPVGKGRFGSNMCHLGEAYSATSWVGATLENETDTERDQKLSLRSLC